MKVLVDGTALPDEEGRALWKRFSDWMEENRGDLAGFAAKEGFASVHPGVQAGRPVLLASRSAPQRPYTSAKPEEDGPRHAHGGDHPTSATGGSRDRQPEGNRMDPPRNGRGRSPQKTRR
jgi:hypothetical protein